MHCQSQGGHLNDARDEEVTTVGKFALPGLYMINTREKPSTKAATKMTLGKEVHAGAKTVIKTTGYSVTSYPATACTAITFSAP